MSKKENIKIFKEKFSWLRNLQDLTLKRIEVDLNEEKLNTDKLRFNIQPTNMLTIDCYSVLSKILEEYVQFAVQLNSELAEKYKNVSFENYPLLSVDLDTEVITVYNPTGILTSIGKLKGEMIEIQEKLYKERFELIQKINSKSIFEKFLTFLHRRKTRVENIKKEVDGVKSVMNVLDEDKTYFLEHNFTKLVNIVKENYENEFALKFVIRKEE